MAEAKIIIRTAIAFPSAELRDFLRRVASACQAFMADSHPTDLIMMTRRA